MWQGDGNTMCNVPDAATAAKQMAPNYELRGHMDIHTLDSALCQDVKVCAKEPAMLAEAAGPGGWAGCRVQSWPNAARAAACQV